MWVIVSLAICHTLTYTSGVTDFSSTNVEIIGDYITTITWDESIPVNNFSIHRSGTVTSTTTLSGTLVVGGLFDLNNSASGQLSGGTIKILGDANLTYLTTVGGSTTNLTLEIAGNTDQTITAVRDAELSNVVLNSTGGTVTVTGDFVVGGSFTYQQGTFDFTGSHVHFAGSTTGNIDVNGVQFNDVTISKVSNNNLDFLSNMDVNGNLTFNYPTGYHNINGSSGQINLAGNLSAIAMTGNNGTTGNLVINLDGNLDQYVTGSANTYITSLAISSTGGIVYFVGEIGINGGLKHNSGSVDFITNSSHLIFTHGGDLTIDASSLNFNDITFSKNYNYQDINIVGTMSIGGNLTLDSATSDYNFNSGEILLSGDLNVLYNGSFEAGGNGKITLVGTNNQSISYTAGSIPDFEINKSGGVVTMDSNFTGAFAQNFNLTSGSLDINGYDMTVAGVLTLESGTTLTLNSGSYSPNSGGNYIDNGATINP